MEQQLTQCEVEWLRCLTTSLELFPVLPENVHLKLEGAQLLETKSGRTVITQSGSALLRERTPQETPTIAEL